MFAVIAGVLAMFLGACAVVAGAILAVDGAGFVGSCGDDCHGGIFYFAATCVLVGVGLFGLHAGLRLLSERRDLQLAELDRRRAELRRRIGPD
jgi:hypothetical protein